MNQAMISSIESSTELLEQSDATSAALSVHSRGTLRDRVLAFEAPYLEQKLVSTGLVDDAREAAALFRELKRYLFLAGTTPVAVPMMSALVDAAWHQFILYTTEYAAFCAEMFGELQHHAPRSGSAAGVPREQSNLALFVDTYREHFGPLADQWHNERCVRLHSRLVHSQRDARLDVRLDAEHALLVRTRKDEEQIVCRTSPRARDALEFIASHSMFLVREVAGLRGPREQLALVRPLVEFEILSLAL